MKIISQVFKMAYQNLQNKHVFAKHKFCQNEICFCNLHDRLILKVFIYDVCVDF